MTRGPVGVALGVLAAALLAAPLAAEAAAGRAACAQVRAWGSATSLARCQFTDDSADPVARARRFIDANVAALEMAGAGSADLVHLETVDGLASRHTRFQQFLFGYPVFNAFVTVHEDRKGTIRRMHSAYRRLAPDTVPGRMNVTQDGAEAIARGVLTQYAGGSATGAAVRRARQAWFPRADGTLVLAWEILVTADRPPIDLRIAVDRATGEVLLQQDRLVRWVDGQGRALRPNPIQVSGDGTLTDAASATYIDSLAATVDLLQLAEGTGLLKGRFVDPSVPSLNFPQSTYPAANEPTRSYLYDVADLRFAQVNAYNAIDSAQRYLQALGFSGERTVPNGIRFQSTVVYPHWDANDNSFYRPTTDSLHFGDGGVPDAEDGDIMVHEYGHAVQHAQNPVFGCGSGCAGDLGAMGEGFSDYFAAVVHAGDGDAAYQQANAACVGEWDSTSYTATPPYPPCLRRVDGTRISGMAFTLFDGRATWDRAGAASATPPPGIVWVDDALPAGAVPVGMGETWSWTGASPAPFSGTLAHPSALASGLHQHYFYGASAPLPIGAGDTLYAYVYLDPANPPSEVMLQWHDGTSWEHRAYWGANNVTWGIDGTASRRYMGALPASGQWVRLAVPATLVGLNGRSVSGMAFTLFDGRTTWDRAGVEPAAAWVDDAIPAGAVPAGIGEGWTWTAADPPPSSGALAHASALATGLHQHYFFGASSPLAISANDTLFAYVYLDPANPPSEVMLQWHDGNSWEHRAYWGADNITAWGVNGTRSRRYMGPLPPAGQWVRLEVSAAQVGLDDKVYPTSLVGEIHKDGEIWSRALWDIRNAIGGSVASQLVLEHHYSVPAGATMPQAALEMIAVDADLFGGHNEVALRQAFCARRILTGTDCTLPTPSAVSIPVAKDLLVRQSATNRNEGQSPLLRVKGGAGTTTRVVLEFDPPGIDLGRVKSAVIEMTIADSDQAWGAFGRTIDAHPVLVDFAEGNGVQVGAAPPAMTLGTGAGATWNCPTDIDIANGVADCAAPWNGGFATGAPVPYGTATPPAVQTNGAIDGRLRWTVTDDVKAGVHRWVVKKTFESDAGRVDFHAKDGALALDPYDAAKRRPRLIVTYD